MTSTDALRFLTLLAEARDVGRTNRFVAACRAAGLIAALGLAGCAHAPRPATILIPCDAPAVETPVFPFDVLPADADLFTKVKTLLADRRVRQGYEERLEAAAEACRR